MSLLTDREVSRDGNTPPLPTSKPRRKLPRVYIAIVVAALVAMGGSIAVSTAIIHAKTGPPGARGIAGPTGMQGAIGARGPRGPQGKAAVAPVTTTTSTPTTTSSSYAAKTVGTLSIQPTSFTKLSTSGDTATWRVTISVKNNGTSSAGPFCGDDGASLMDSQARTFDGTSVIFGDASNCGGDIQPGLTQGGFEMDFKTPASSQPTMLSLWGGFENADASSAATWIVS